MQAKTMRTETEATRVLADVVGPKAGALRGLTQLALLAIGVAALWISAKIQVPTLPVPTTMQTFVVLTIGAAYGARLGLATVLAYLAIGALGEPVFAGTPEKGLGLLYMAGPTGGYLLGFALAAFGVGALSERGWDRSMLAMAAAMLVGLALVYLPGAAWIGWLFGWENAFALGVHPFLWIDLAKAALAVLLFPAVWRLIGR